MRSLRIVVADDECIIRMDLKSILTSMGHQVIAESSNGEQAVEQCRVLQPDLVFLDVKMPVMDGLEALRQITRDGGPLPAIMVTAFSEKSMVEKAVELGAQAYVVKPFKAATIFPAIELALSHFDELRVLRHENASLKDAIEAGKLVTKAKILLAEHEGITESEAFRRMQRMSMDRNKKMREVAEAILLIYGAAQPGADAAGQVSGRARQGG